MYQMTASPQQPQTAAPNQALINYYIQQQQQQMQDPSTYMQRAVKAGEGAQGLNANGQRMAEVAQMQAYRQMLGAMGISEADINAGDLLTHPERIPQVMWQSQQAKQMLQGQQAMQKRAMPGSHLPRYMQWAMDNPGALPSYQMTSVMGGDPNVRPANIGPFQGVETPVDPQAQQAAMQKYMEGVPKAQRAPDSMWKTATTPTAPTPTSTTMGP